MVAALAAVAVLGTAAAHHPPRPDLVVPRGSVRAAAGTLAGSFAVKNAGHAHAPGSTAGLTVKVGRRSRLIKRYAIGPLSRSASRQVDVAVKLPATLPAGTLPVRVCADSGAVVRERSETNNCRLLGRIVITTGAGTGGDTNPGTGGDTSPGTGGDTQPTSTVPTNPIPFSKNQVFMLNSAQTPYWVYVPDAYDDSHQTPMRLLIWLHGCGGESSGDIYTVSGVDSQSWISITVGGREDDCWDPNTDGAKVFAAITDLESHFNIDRHRVVIGGYSSGGDLAYRTAFYNANTFAGLLAENTSPFRDTGSSQADSLAAAAWKFNVVHLAHLQDGTYPIDGVRQETDAMKNAGFPITRFERDGTHYDADAPAADPTSGTDHDLRAYLLPHMTDDWRSP